MKESEVSRIIKLKDVLLFWIPKKPRSRNQKLILYCSVFFNHRLISHRTCHLRNFTGKKMQRFHLLQCFLVLNLLLGSSISQKTDPSSCGEIQIQPPFLSFNPTGSFPFHRMILCRSQRLYFRTSIGLFPISSIDYRTKTLIISHPSSSSSSIHFVSPSLLSSGFPSPPERINSLLLFHCSNPTQPISEFAKNCSHLQEEEGLKASCLVFDDLGKLNKSFHPNAMNCSHYERVYRNTSENEFRSGFKLGTSISFDIPGHVPNLCNECEKPEGHCGVGLRCICHALECKDKVFSEGGIVSPAGKFLVSWLAVFVMIMSPM